MWLVAEEEADEGAGEGDRHEPDRGESTTIARFGCWLEPLPLAVLPLGVNWAAGVRRLSLLLSSEDAVEGEREGARIGCPIVAPVGAKGYIEPNMS